jgi:hypothetical protein
MGILMACMRGLVHTMVQRNKVRDFSLSYMVMSRARPSMLHRSSDRRVEDLLWSNMGSS